ncbi:ABC transporter ATP-binding protein [Streptomyces sp. NPDC093252]|uniref:ABC transporter ATP-binding protein n=1 Tax=Streptomyces sp. NPDC093252 TaxID=3154980 RepID=UPI00341A3910
MHKLSSPVRLSLAEVTKSYGRGTESKTVLDRITLDVRTGELVCVVGPSGAGKTTLLRCLTGLMPPTSGTVALDGAPLTGTSDRISLVFQEYSRSLFPWLTIEKNVSLPLRARGVAKARTRPLVAETLKSVGLHDVGGLHPWQLSGGMQQRVAIARALVTEPEVLVMDEPFASIDAQTRMDLEDLTLRIQRERNVSVILVTHDIDEAVYLADRVVVLSKNPATVQATLDVPLGVDRDQIHTRQDQRFVDIRTNILELIRETQLRDQAEKSTS